MPTSVGPNPALDSNIIFSYDVGDTSNSYRGQPTTNAVGNLNSFNPLDLYTWASSGNTSTWSRDTTIFPSPVNGIPLKEVSSGTDSYSSTYNNPGNNISAASSGQTWTVSVYALAAAGTNLQVWIFGSNSSGNYIELDAQYFTATGVWQRISISMTFTNGSTAYVQARVATATNGATVWWDGLQVEQKSYPTQFVKGTRSVTQGLLPLIGNASLDISNVSFTSNAQMTFDGTDDYFNIPTNFGTVTQYTVEYVAYLGASSRMPIAARTNGNFYKFGDNSWRYVHGGIGDEFYHSTSPSISGYIHCVVTYDGSLVRVWRNGYYAGAKASSGTADFSNGFKIGYWSAGGNYAWSGPIPIAKIYNVALSPDQVKQNYNQYKTRFNLS
jgi:hypothetical protein